MVKNKKPMGELTLVESIRRMARRASAGRHGLELGIGDDCAIFEPSAGEELLFTTDMLIEGRHFLPNTHSPRDLGWKALARGLSDIAAMGGIPRFCLVSLAVADWADRAFVDGFYRGLLSLASETGTRLAGGDLARAGRLFCDIVVCGAAPRGTALRRGTARAGDVLYVSGALGGSALGLERGRGPAWHRHLRPTPRLALGQLLRTRLHATAAMDLSDGLSLDLHRLAQASGLRAEIETPPIYPGASLEQALHGGEDYELLFTDAAGRRVPAKMAGVRLTEIGRVTGGRKKLLRDANGSRGELMERGWEHFRR